MTTLVSLESIDGRVVAVSLARPELRVEAASEDEAVAAMTTLLREQTAGKKIVSIELDDSAHEPFVPMTGTSAEIMRLVTRMSNRRRKKELKELREAHEREATSV